MTVTVGKLTRLLPIGMLVALTACSSQPRMGDYRPPAAGCCKALSDYTFPALIPGSDVQFSLGPSNPTIALDELTHFAGFQVPGATRPSALIVRSYLSTSFLPKATAVAPEVLFFGDRFEMLKRIVVVDMQREGGFWRSSVSGRVPVPGNARYIVIVPTKGEAGVPTIRSDNGTPYRLPPAALGDLSIRLYEDTSRR